MRSIKRKLSLLLILAMCLALCACGAQSINEPQATIDPEADEKSLAFVDSMDTFMTLTAYGSNRDDALTAAQEEILRLNDLFSIGVETSEVARLNKFGSNSLSNETLTVVERALEVNELTAGCFDITVTPLMEAWGFTTKDYRVPSLEEISEILTHTGLDKISIDGNKIKLSDDARIDLGGIAKGYTSQRVMEVFKENGVTSGIVSLGGNVQCLGLKPDGSKWRVGIREPWGFESSYVAVLSVEDAAVITSGGYERYFVDEETGKLYCHILDPKTGYPVESDIDSVTIVSKDGTLADGLSTALYILGIEKACEFWKQNSELFEAIIIDKDGGLYVTSGIVDDIQTEKSFTVIE